MSSSTNSSGSGQQRDGSPFKSGSQHLSQPATTNTNSATSSATNSATNSAVGTSGLSVGATAQRSPSPSVQTRVFPSGSGPASPLSSAASPAYRSSQYAVAKASPLASTMSTATGSTIQHPARRASSPQQRSSPAQSPSGSAASLAASSPSRSIPSSSYASRQNLPVRGSPQYVRQTQSPPTSKTAVPSPLSSATSSRNPRGQYGSQPRAPTPLSTASTTAGYRSPKTGSSPTRVGLGGSSSGPNSPSPGADPKSDRLCSYSKKKCNQRRMDGYDYCVRHILEDANAPYKRCAFTLPNTQKLCSNPVPINQPQRYCSQHLQVLGALPKKQPKARRNSTSSNPGSRTSSPLPPEPHRSKSELARIAKKRRLKRTLRERGISITSLAASVPPTARSTPAGSPSSSAPGSPKQPSSPTASQSHDEALSSDPDDVNLQEFEDIFASEAGIKVSKKWQANFQAGIEESDDDSDGDGADALSLSEPVSVDELKLRRTQILNELAKLYEQHFQHLKRRLSDARRDMYARLAAEEDALDPDMKAAMSRAHTHAPPRPMDEDSDEKLAADRDTRCQPPPRRMDLLPNDIPNTRTDRPTGEEAALRVQRLRYIEANDVSGMRIQAGHAVPAKSFKCAFSPPYMAPCQHRALPFSRYCIRHIMQDPHQQLYQRCTYVSSSGSRCSRILAKFESPPVCIQHVQLKDYKRNPRLCVRVSSEALQSMIRDPTFWPQAERTSFELLGAELDSDLRQLFDIESFGVLARAAASCEEGNEYESMLQDIKSELHTMLDQSEQPQNRPKQGSSADPRRSSLPPEAKIPKRAEDESAASAERNMTKNSEDSPGRHDQNAAAAQSSSSTSAQPSKSHPQATASAAAADTQEETDGSKSKTLASQNLSEDDKSVNAQRACLSSTDSAGGVGEKKTNDGDRDDGDMAIDDDAKEAAKPVEESEKTGYERVSTPDLPSDMEDENIEVDESELTLDRVVMALGEQASFDEESLKTSLEADNDSDADDDDDDGPA